MVRKLYLNKAALKKNQWNITQCRKEVSDQAVKRHKAALNAYY